MDHRLERPVAENYGTSFSRCLNKNQCYPAVLFEVRSELSAALSSDCDVPCRKLLTLWPRDIRPWRGMDGRAGIDDCCHFVKLMSSDTVRVPVNKRCTRGG